MDFAAFILELQKLEGGADLAKQLEPIVEDYDKNKTELDKAKQDLAVVDGRDLGKMIALVDTLKTNGLDTPEKIVDFKNKTEGLEKSVEERDEDIKEMRVQLEARETQVNEDAQNTLLLADAKVALAGIRGAKVTVFNNAVETEMRAGKFTRDGEKGLLFNGKPITESHEYFRDTWGNGFAEKPQGTNNPPAPADNTRQSGGGNLTTLERLRKGFSTGR